jgi:CubicO group peptidase (beta-lactamase class C family)
MSDGGLSKSRLDRMREVMAGYAERDDVHGFVTLISRRGETRVEVFGVKAIGSHDAVERDSIFRIASMTKPVTAVAAMILVEECVLRLDEPVDRLLPELADRRVLTRPDAPLDDTVAAERPITVRDLLTFRAGYGLVLRPPDSTPIQRAMSELGFPQGPPNPATVPEPDEVMRGLGTLPLLHQPGEKWVYNTASDILGVLIARAAGQSLESFFSERIFTPLGMQDTGFSVPAAKQGRLMTSYMTNPVTGESELFDGPTGQWSQPPAFPSGAGGLVSTVDDFAAFGQMLLANGVHNGTRILSRTSVATMTVDHLSSGQKAATEWVPGYFDSHGWGFGVSVVTRREDTFAPVGTYGWDGGLGTSWYSDPSEDLVGILLTQQSWTSPVPPTIRNDFWTLTYQAIDD